MLRSLYSGVSGMKNLQNELDVVANNIANVNTIGFKSSRVVFQDIISQNIQAASAPNGGRGGTNAMQIGLGVSTAAIDTNTGAGATQITGNSSDLAIQGNGYFVVNRGGEQQFTQNGDFTLDSAGNLIASDGSFVQGAVATNPNDAVTNGTNATNTGLKNIKVPTTFGGGTYQAGSFAIVTDGSVTAKYTIPGANGAADTTQTFTIGKVAVATFTNPNGLAKAGNTSFTASNNSGNAVINDPGNNGAGALQAGALEMSNVDLSTEFTNMIVASRAYQANAKSITTSDEILQTLISLKQ